jgi:hypothetical protein
MGKPIKLTKKQADKLAAEEAERIQREAEANTPEFAPPTVEERVETLEQRVDELNRRVSKFTEHCARRARVRAAERGSDQGKSVPQVSGVRVRAGRAPFVVCRLCQVYKCRVESLSRRRLPRSLSSGGVFFVRISP